MQQSDLYSRAEPPPAARPNIPAFCLPTARRAGAPWQAAGWQRGRAGEGSPSGERRPPVPGLRLPDKGAGRAPGHNTYLPTVEPQGRAVGAQQGR